MDWGARFENGGKSVFPSAAVHAALAMALALALVENELWGREQSS
jgi:hypothetical protein